MFGDSRLPPLASALGGERFVWKRKRRVGLGLARDREPRAVRSPAAASKDVFYTILSELRRQILTELAGEHHTVFS